MNLSERPFADLVFHVLAHVPGDAAPSVWDPAYVAWCEEHLGSASSRTLAEDASALATLLPDHDGLVRAQMLAWLFRDLERARTCFDRSLEELRDADVDDASIFRFVSKYQPAELLWCAIGLEDEHRAKLPPISIFGIAEAMAAMRDVAPSMDTFDIGVVRSLRLRGRVRGKEIWIGEAPLDHTTWQAAHEATVAEVSDPKLSFVETERRAIALLTERAAKAGRADAHAKWLASVRLP
jgi:hypothetical protein